jgi:hypothetical protein
MPRRTFDAFLATVAGRPAHVTLKRFSLLCAQGPKTDRGLSRLLLLLAGAPEVHSAALLSGLELLGQLDTRQALQVFAARNCTCSLASTVWFPPKRLVTCWRYCRMSKSV